MDEFLHSIGINDMSWKKKILLLNEIHSKYIDYLKSGVHFNNRRLSFWEYLDLLKAKEDIDTYNMFGLRNRNIIINMIKNLDSKFIVKLVMERHNIKDEG